MFESALMIGRVRGIRIQVHYTWLVIFALLSISLVANFRATHPEWGEATVLSMALLAVLLFFLSIVLHELGHSLVAVARGVPVRSITLFIFGGVAQMEKDSETARDEFWIAVAGPLVSLALAAVFLGIGAALSGLHEPLAVTAGWLALINAVLAIFNMMPGFPLDGGRVFRALVWGISGDAVKGMRWAVAGGRITAYLLFAVGTWLFLGLGQVIGGLWMVAIGWFLLNAAEGSGRSFLHRELLKEVRAADLVAGAPPAVPSGTTIERWVGEWALGRGVRACLVTEADRSVGLVTLTDIRKVERDRWSTTPVEEVMTPLSDLHSVPADATLERVLDLMTRHNLNQVPVGEGARMTGWLDRDQVLRTLRIRLEIGDGAELGSVVRPVGYDGPERSPASVSADHGRGPG